MVGRTQTSPGLSSSSPVLYLKLPPKIISSVAAKTAFRFTVGPLTTSKLAPTATLVSA